MLISRTIEPLVKEAAKTFPLVALTGPRQSGKTTLARMLFPHYSYVSLEDIDQITYARRDPRDFLTKNRRCILDEIQKAPELFPYLQSEADRGSAGDYILTGSQNFLLHKHISQSLSGRIAMLSVYPFSLGELKRAGFNYEDPEQYLFNGQYPPIYDRTISPNLWYPSYIQTYIERDIRDLTRITDLSAFQTFVRLCAGRTGQVLNLSSLARDSGITHNTAKAWISLLETSFIVFLLQPYYRNFSKRLIKMPKLYFYDTGLAASLLGIQTTEQLSTHYLKGGLFENLVITEHLKHKVNTAAAANLFFWQDKTAREIDLIIESADTIRAIEIKSGKTIADDFGDNLRYFQKLYHDEHKTLKSAVIYGGEIEQKLHNIEILSWKKIPLLPSPNLKEA